VSHGDQKETDRPQPPVSDEGGDRRQAGYHRTGERCVRVFMRSRSRLRISPRGRAGENGTAGGAQSRKGATLRRDPGDCNAAAYQADQ